MDCIMRYVFSLRVFKQMDAHTRPAFINYFAHTHTSFILLNTHGKTMFSQDQILVNPKGYGHVHDVCVKKICVCFTVFAVKQLITAVSAVLSQIIYQECVAR